VTEILHFCFGKAGKMHVRSLCVIASIAALAMAGVSWTDGFFNATLTGTVDIPIGNYVITNTIPNPFTSVNLTMTLDSNPYPLDTSDTSLITGTGEFHISATATDLTFDTANANNSNPADLQFVNSGNLSERYTIGFNGAPGFEAGFSDLEVIIAEATLPTVFGVIVPEPSMTGIAGLGCLAALRWRRRADLRRASHPS
jgi:hypothetical protein